MGFKISYIYFYQNGSIFCYRFFSSLCFFCVSSITTQSTLQLVAQLLKRMTQEYMLRHFFVDIIVNHSGHFLSKQSSIRFCFVHVINNRIVAFQWTCAITHVIFAMTLFFLNSIIIFSFFIQFFCCCLSWSVEPVYAANKRIPCTFFTFTNGFDFATSVLISATGN